MELFLAILNRPDSCIFMALCKLKCKFFRLAKSVLTRLLTTLSPSLTLKLRRMLGLQLFLPFLEASYTQNLHSRSLRSVKSASSLLKIVFLSYSKCSVIFYNTTQFYLFQIFLLLLIQSDQSDIVTQIVDICFVLDQHIDEPQHKIGHSLAFFLSDLYEL